MAITDIRIKVLPYVTSLRLRASMKFSSRFMNLRSLSLLAVLNLASVLVTPKMCQAWLVLLLLDSFAAGTVPGLVQLRVDNTDFSIDCSVVPLHIPFQTAELKKSEDKTLRAMIL